MKKRVVAILALTLLLTVTVSVASPVFAASSEQVVFSGEGFSHSAQTPVGFWIWCEGQSGNPYQGECNGAMYFYALGITKQVDGSASGDSNEQFTMSVQSSDGSVICTLENVSPLPPSSGPTNTVDISCKQPGPFTDGVSMNAVVQVTSS